MTGPYTFDSFIVSESSRLAFDAAVAVAENRTRNPLFLYGRSGGGKTHLLHAIERAIPSGRVLRLGAHDLATELVAAIWKNDVAALHESYAALDVLLLDEFELSPGKKSTCYEIFRILTGAAARGARVVVVSSKPMPLSAHVLLADATIIEVA